MKRVIGDIRRFPRKGSLQDRIKETVEEGELKSIVGMDTVEEAKVEEIIIYGSWGRGTANPFISDLDVAVLASGGGGTDPFVPEYGGVDLNFILFGGEDIFVYFDESKYRNQIIDFMQENEPNIAYNLMGRKTVTAEDFG